MYDQGAPWYYVRVFYYWHAHTHVHRSSTVQLCTMYYVRSHGCMGDAVTRGGHVRILYAHVSHASVHACIRVCACARACACTARATALQVCVCVGADLV